MKIWLRNVKPPYTLVEREFLGPPHQSTFVDPLSKSGVVHEGRAVEELEKDGFVGVYVFCGEFDSRIHHFG